MKAEDQMPSQLLSFLILTSMQMSSREVRRPGKQPHTLRGEAFPRGPYCPYAKLSQTFGLGPGPLRTVGQVREGRGQVSGSMLKPGWTHSES